jgi:peptidylprolyl isomerase
MTKKASLVLGAAAALALAVLPAAAQKDNATPNDDKKSEKSEGKMHKTMSGLQYEDTVVGTGETPQKGQTAVVHYTGWLWENGAKGNKFDSSVDRGKPIEFVIGGGRIIKGWDEGVGSMKVGGKRTLLIPPQLGYGAAGRPPVIPPNSTLIFDVELVGVK